MLEDSGSRYECPSYGLKCGACISLNSLRRILLKLSQKNDRGGGSGIVPRSIMIDKLIYPVIYWKFKTTLFFSITLQQESV